jgi:hypothetical protein
MAVILSMRNLHELIKAGLVTVITDGGGFRIDIFMQVPPVGRDLAKSEY